MGSIGPRYRDDNPIAHAPDSHTPARAGNPCRDSNVRFHPLACRSQGIPQITLTDHGSHHRFLRALAHLHRERYRDIESQSITNFGVIKIFSRGQKNLETTWLLLPLPLRSLAQDPPNHSKAGKVIAKPMATLCRSRACHHGGANEWNSSYQSSHGALRRVGSQFCLG